MQPLRIALCGNPKSGKSEVQRILQEQHGVIPVDDGEVLREFGIDYLGLTPEDVYTQAGKSRFTEILGKSWQHRDILGTLGNHLEEMFGEQIMPFIACRDLKPELSYSFGSVRKEQGAYYKQIGGVVIEVVRPGAEPSGYDFDKFNRDHVTWTISNDGSIADLEATVARLVDVLRNN